MLVAIVLRSAGHRCEISPRPAKATQPTLHACCCRTEFCWLCGAVLGLHGMNHFFGLKGCTMYGSKRWSLDRVRRHRRWSPVAYPAVMVAAAVVTPIIYLGLPIAMAVEENRACKTSGMSRGKR